MDTIIIVVIVLLAILAVASALIFRRGKAEIRGPFGTAIRIKGAEDTSITARDSGEIGDISVRRQRPPGAPTTDAPPPRTVRKK